MIKHIDRRHTCQRVKHEAERKSCVFANCQEGLLIEVAVVRHDGRYEFWPMCLTHAKLCHDRQREKDKQDHRWRKLLDLLGR